MTNDRQPDALETLRAATRHSPYEQNLWLVGGYVRDKALGNPSPGDDLDLVTEADAGELARFLLDKGITDHAPVTYPRFGTAMVSIGGQQVELVTARRESYAEGSRKPHAVESATLEEDALRRDFTINTLLENLHSGKLRDPLGLALSDLKAGIIRTPAAPEVTFSDDPLRMLRAVRFAARFGFTIDARTWKGIRQNAERLTGPVSWERIRDEFLKIVGGKTPSVGLELLRESGLVAQFAPELLEMVGVTQNAFHAYPVWEHTLTALDNLAASEPNAAITLRLAVLLHDIGKPRTKSVGPDGRIHFYHHEDIGAEMTRKLLTRLKLPNADIATMTQLVGQHMRIGEYQPQTWTDAAVRRFIRASGSLRDDLFALHRADVSALGEEHQDISRAGLLRERIDALQSERDATLMTSPLSGVEIMAALAVPPGPLVGKIKEHLTNEVIEGHLREDDQEAATRLAREFVKSDSSVGMSPPQPSRGGREKTLATDKGTRSKA